MIKKGIFFLVLAAFVASSKFPLGFELPKKVINDDFTPVLMMSSLSSTTPIEIDQTKPVCSKVWGSEGSFCSGAKLLAWDRYWNLNLNRTMSRFKREITSGQDPSERNSRTKGEIDSKYMDMVDRCWTFILRAREASLCYVCSNKNSQYFYKGRAVISQDSCDAMVGECIDFFSYSIDLIKKFKSKNADKKEKINPNLARNIDNLHREMTQSNVIRYVNEFNQIQKIKKFHTSRMTSMIQSRTDNNPRNLRKRSKQTRKAIQRRIKQSREVIERKRSEPARKVIERRRKEEARKEIGRRRTIYYTSRYERSNQNKEAIIQRTRRRRIRWYIQILDKQAQSTANEICIRLFRLHKSPLFVVIESLLRNLKTKGRRSRVLQFNHFDVLPSSHNPFIGDVGVFRQRDSMFMAFDGIKGTTLDIENTFLKPLNLTLIFP